MFWTVRKGGGRCPLLWAAMVILCCSCSCSNNRQVVGVQAATTDGVGGTHWPSWGRSGRTTTIPSRRELGVTPINDPKSRRLWLFLTSAAGDSMTAVPSVSASASTTSSSAPNDTTMKTKTTNNNNPLLEINRKQMERLAEAAFEEVRKRAREAGQLPEPLRVGLWVSIVSLTSLVEGFVLGYLGGALWGLPKVVWKEHEQKQSTTTVGAIKSKHHGRDKEHVRKWHARSLEWAKKYYKISFVLKLVSVVLGSTRPSSQEEGSFNLEKVIKAKEEEVLISSKKTATRHGRV